jgi:hypothetical protein
LACIAAIATAACQVTPGLGDAGGWDRAVSGQMENWGSYRPQGVYRIERDVFLLNVSERTNGPGLVPGMEADVPPGTFRGPTGMDDYLAAPQRYRGVTGVVVSGTRLRAETLRAKGNLLDKNVTVRYVRGRIMDGEFQGWVVDLQAVSIYRADPDGGPVRLAGPNEDFLRPI